MIGEKNFVHIRDGLFDTCPPYNFTFNDPRILEKLGDGEVKNCTKIEFLTIFENGRLRINQNFPNYKDFSCAGRCAFFYKNYENRVGEWCETLQKNCTYECDVIEVNCMRDGKLEYIFAHSQIFEYNRDRKQVFGSLYRETSSPKVKADRFHPDVHIMLIDSMGLFSVLRQMPETVRFLREELDAVIFEQYTRTAPNSRDNMFAGMFGEIPIDVDRRLYEAKNLPKTLQGDTCEKPVDDKNFIQFEYEDAGYKTMYAQDNYLVTFGYLQCLGVINQIATHYMRPFQLIEMINNDVWSNKPIGNRSFENDNLLEKYLRNSSLCQDPYNHALDYTAKFYNSYKDKPKMSIMWSSLAHHDELPARQADRHFVDFFLEHKEKLDESFFIFMSDHGQRFNAIADTEQGLYEMNNAAMFFLVSEKVTLQPSSNFSETKHQHIEKTFGTSWLREMPPNMSRGCRNLPISSQYCTCNYGTTLLKEHDKVWDRIHWILDDDMNAYLKEGGLEKVCEKMKVMKLTEIYKMSSMGSSSFYRVLFESVTGGIFVVQYELTKDDVLRPSPREWKRVNAYGTAADCLHSKYAEYKPMCYCS
ncbi:unnamed protein product, partial [Mesorhabditis belari]|uniref:Uncharacterized protein n=1 Tax=Mesorhabditis belari TaxID=2138241 RepID=A0AAF3FSZ1_9BILA